MDVSPLRTKEWPLPNSQFHKYESIFTSKLASAVGYVSSTLQVPLAPSLPWKLLLSSQSSEVHRLPEAW